MKAGRVISAAALLFLAAFAAWGQSTSRTSASAFEPLDHWKADVLAGDGTALARLYTTTPPSQNQTPAGKTQDPSEEPKFWSALAASGLANLQPKILDIEHPQPGVVSLVLRVQFNLKTGSGERPFVVETAQVWLQQPDGWRIAQTERGDAVPNPPRRLPEPAKPNTNLYPTPEEAKSEIAAALAGASKDHKRVILVFGGNWCYDCHVLDATFHSEALAPLVNKNFYVVHINIGEMDKNLDIADRYGIPIKKGVPALAVLDSDGKLLYSQKQGEFENSVRIGPVDVAEFLNKWKPAT